MGVGNVYGSRKTFVGMAFSPVGLSVRVFVVLPIKFVTNIPIG